MEFGGNLTIKSLMALSDHSITFFCMLDSHVLLVQSSFSQGQGDDEVDFDSDPGSHEGTPGRGA